MIYCGKFLVTSFLKLNDLKIHLKSRREWNNYQPNEKIVISELDMQHHEINQRRCRKFILFSKAEMHQ